VTGARIRTAAFCARGTNQGKECSLRNRKDFFDNRDGDETFERDMSVVTHLMCGHTHGSHSASRAQRASLPGFAPLVTPVYETLVQGDDQRVVRTEPAPSRWIL
jgi:hypothetical protein